MFNSAKVKSFKKITCMWKEWRKTLGILRKSKLFLKRVMKFWLQRLKSPILHGNLFSLHSFTFMSRSESMWFYVLCSSKVSKSWGLSSLTTLGSVWGSFGYCALLFPPSIQLFSSWFIFPVLDLLTVITFLLHADFCIGLISLTLNWRYF